MSATSYFTAEGVIDHIRRLPPDERGRLGPLLAPVRLPGYATTPTAEFAVRKRQLDEGIARAEEETARAEQVLQSIAGARVFFDDDRQAVTVDGKAHKVKNPAAYKVFKAIYSRETPRITAEAVRKLVRGIGEKAVTRHIKSLPKVLQRILHSDKHGHWHELPSLPPKK
jgi:hypothetical protein